MINFLPHKIRNNTFLLSSNRTIFWEEEKCLVLSDLHLGKSGHFRKSGIGIPQNIFKEDMQCLLTEIEFFKVKKIIIVGDLFHSSINKELEFFLRWREDISYVDILLVKGNHDILKKEWYENAGIQVYINSLAIGPFIFTHDFVTCEANKDAYCISGHIHPGIIVNGMGKQTLRLPCFYFAESYAVLPAFGKFTGTHPVKPKAGDAVYALVENKVLKFQ